MKIIRVKLNPEQTVLSCCDSTHRAVTMPSAQCIPMCNAYTAVFDAVFR
ncbi:MAG: hypothetical protein PHV17_03960 [Candidatus Omnitrophica bacterium]|nr:hypothetical protein [Candidatus Omnitrophota bacterium]